MSNVKIMEIIGDFDRDYVDDVMVQMIVDGLQWEYVSEIHEIFNDCCYPENVIPFLNFKVVFYLSFNPDNTTTLNLIKRLWEDTDLKERIKEKSTLEMENFHE